MADVSKYGYFRDLDLSTMQKTLLTITFLLFAVSCSTPLRVLYLDIKDDRGNRVKDITMIDAELEKTYKYKFFPHSWSHEDMKQGLLKFYIPKRKKVELKLYELESRYNGFITGHLYESQYLTVFPTDTFFQITMKCTDAYLEDQCIIKELLQKSRTVYLRVIDENDENIVAMVEVLDLPLNFKSESFGGYPNFDHSLILKVPLPAGYNRLRVSGLGFEEEIVYVGDHQYYIEVRLKRGYCFF